MSFYTTFCRFSVFLNLVVFESLFRLKLIKMFSEFEFIDFRIWFTRFSGLEDGGELRVVFESGSGGCVGGYSLLG